MLADELKQLSKDNYTRIVDQLKNHAKDGHTSFWYQTRVNKINKDEWLDIVSRLQQEGLSATIEFNICIDNIQMDYLTVNWF